MMRPDALRKYRETEVMTSSPQKLVILLYEEAIKCLDLAILKIKTGETGEGTKLLLKTQKIVAELIYSLNMDAGEISLRLYTLYEYIYRRLIEANMRKDCQIIEEVLSLLKPLKEAWIKAVEVIKDEGHN